jgi:hypothetical protein
LQTPFASHEPAQLSGSSAFFTGRQELFVQVVQTAVHSLTAQHPAFGMQALPQRLSPFGQHRPLAQLEFAHMSLDVQPVPSPCLAVQTPFAAQ